MLLAVQSIEPLGDRAIELQEFSTKPGADLALILQKQICVAQRLQHPHDFIGLSVSFLLRGAQPVDEIFTNLGSWWEFLVVH